MITQFLDDHSPTVFSGSALPGLVHSALIPGRANGNGTVQFGDWHPLASPDLRAMEKSGCTGCAVETGKTYGKKTPKLMNDMEKEWI